MPTDGPPPAPGPLPPGGLPQLPKDGPASSPALPPLPEPVPIRRHQEKEPTTVRLPATVEGLAVGGEGRFLVFHFRTLNKLGVFDVNEERVVHSLDVPGPTVHFAAGMTKLLVHRPEGKYLYPTGHGVLTSDFKTVPGAAYFQPGATGGQVSNTYLPAHHGPYYFHVKVSAFFPGGPGAAGRGRPQAGIDIHV